MTTPDQIVDERQRLVARLREQLTVRLPQTATDATLPLIEAASSIRRMMVERAEAADQIERDAKRLAELEHDRDEWKGRAADRDAEAEKYARRAWNAESRPQEQPRKATEEEVGVFLASYYGDGSDRDAIHQRTERALNAVFALAAAPPSPAAQEQK